MGPASTVPGKPTRMEAIVDRFVVSRKHEKAIKAGIAATLLVGDGLMQVQVTKGASKADAERFYKRLCSATHHFVYGDIGPDYFMFNKPESACRTCGGLGVDKLTHPDLLIPDQKRSILGGCFVREAFRYNPDTWDGRLMFSLSNMLGFSLDTPWRQLPEKIRTAILYGIDKKIVVTSPPDAKVKRDDQEGREIGFGGIARRIERYYRSYRQRGEASSRMEAWLDKVMVEHTCPDCNGTRLRATRLLFTIQGKTINDVGQLHFDELHEFLGTIKPAGRGADAGRQVVKEIRGRLELLLGIGLDYLNFNRRSATLSGGESQRIRLSTQIGSGLMGMLYVLDEPSIGLHPKDNVKMIATLESLRDIGNTVIVVEHDEDTIRAADHLVEMGPGPGVHGGQVVVQGSLDDVLKCKASPTGQFLSGKRSIATPKRRRKGNGKALVVKGARENNLKSVDVAVPARHDGGHHRRVGLREEHARQRDPLQGSVEAPRGYTHAAGRARRGGRRGARPQGRQHRSVADRPQQPIEPGHLRRLLRHHPRPLHAGAAVRRTRLQAWPLQLQRQRRAVRGVPGRRRHHHPALLHARRRGHLRGVQGRAIQPRDARGHARGKTIDDVLNMSVEEGVAFFAGEPSVSKKIQVLDDLGLGYLTLGQSATTLSGGEAQRIKIATELSTLQRSKHTVYILDEPTTGLHLADVERLLAVVEPDRRRRSYGAVDRASHGRDQDSGSRDRSRARGRPRGRRGGRGRDARGCRRVQGVPHRPIPQDRTCARRPGLTS